MVTTPSQQSSREDEAERFVHALYRGVLRREPDAVGLARYVDAILVGRTHASIIEEFIGCQEFADQTSVKLFVPPGHFYSPIVDPIEADRHLMLVEAHQMVDRLPGIALDRREMIGM